MGSLAKFRGNLLLFSFALVLVVSQVFGDERKPGLVDGSAAALSERASSAPSASSAETQPRDVMLTLSKAKPANPWFAKDPASPAPSSAPAIGDYSDESAPPPSLGAIQIHN